jgi:hypothetical protein
VPLAGAFHETIWQIARDRFLARQLMLLRDLIELRQGLDALRPTAAA